MAMTPWNGDLTQSIKWQQNNAPNLQSMINQKATWYSTFNANFWANFYTYTFNLQSANNFGILIWCIILGVPSQLIGIYPLTAGWAYGNNRQNYIYGQSNSPSPDNPHPTNPNTQGGNFYGGGLTDVLSLAEAVKLLQLRYCALVSNGSVKWINEMLCYIFNGGQPWNMSSGNYFYLADCTYGDGSITGGMKMQYRIGPNLVMSAQLFNVLNSPKYGCMPSCAGVSYTVIRETS